MAERAAAKMLDTAPRTIHQGMGKPDLAWLGWLTAIFGVCVNGIVRGVFPAGVTQAGMPEWRSGLMMMLMSVAMGTFAYALSARSEWMYSAKSMLGLAGLGLFGLAFYYLPGIMDWTLTSPVWPFYIASLVFGCYSGTTYIYAAFHALVHPDKAGRNVSLNESFVAVGMMVGPVLGGWIAKHHGFYLPFVAASGLVALIGVMQYAVHKRRS